MGNDTTLELSADWPHPGFVGNFLPADRVSMRTALPPIGSLGTGPQLSASWSTDELDFNEVNDGKLGVELTLPGDAYQQIDRIVKYGVLVIGLTFTTIFVVALVKSSRAHFVQYLLVGAALCLFTCWRSRSPSNFASSTPMPSRARRYWHDRAYLGRTVSRSSAS